MAPVKEKDTYIDGTLSVDFHDAAQPRAFGTQIQIPSHLDYSCALYRLATDGDTAALMARVDSGLMTW